MGYNKLGRQEAWFHFAKAAIALGGTAWELRRLPEPERTFWLNRGLMILRAENDAYEISHPAKN